MSDVKANAKALTWPPFGFVDGPRHKWLQLFGFELHIFVAGVDRTPDVVEFDDRPGQRRVVLLRRDIREVLMKDRATRRPLVAVHSTFEVRNLAVKA